MYKKNKIVKLKQTWDIAQYLIQKQKDIHKLINNQKFGRVEIYISHGMNNLSLFLQYKYSRTLSMT